MVAGTVQGSRAWPPGIPAASALAGSLWDSTLFCGYITFGCPQACMPGHRAAMVKGVGAGAFPELSISLVPGPFPCGHTVTAAVPAISRRGWRRARGEQAATSVSDRTRALRRPHRHGLCQPGEWLGVQLQLSQCRRGQPLPPPPTPCSPADVGRTWAGEGEAAGNRGRQ